MLGARPGNIRAKCCILFGQCWSGDADPDEAATQLLRGIEQLSQALTDPDSRAVLAKATTAVVARQFYPAIRHLRALLPREERLLAGPLQ